MSNTIDVVKDAHVLASFVILAVGVIAQAAIIYYKVRQNEKRIADHESRLDVKHDWITKVENAGENNCKKIDNLKAHINWIKDHYMKESEHRAHCGMISSDTKLYLEKAIQEVGKALGEKMDQNLAAVKADVRSSLETIRKQIENNGRSNKG